MTDFEKLKEMQEFNRGNDTFPNEKGEDSHTFPNEKWEEAAIFSEEEWNSLVKWHPVSNLDPYEDAPQAVKDYHSNYVTLWNLRTKKAGR